VRRASDATASPAGGLLLARGLTVEQSFTGTGGLLPMLAASPVGRLTGARDLLVAISSPCGCGEKTNEEDGTWDPPVILYKDGFG